MLSWDPSFRRLAARREYPLVVFDSLLAPYCRLNVRVEFVGVLVDRVVAFAPSDGVPRGSACLTAWSEQVSLLQGGFSRILGFDVAGISLDRRRVERWIRRHRQIPNGEHGHFDDATDCKPFEPKTFLGERL